MYELKEKPAKLPLIFTLKKEWFEKIKSGEKTHEYREVKEYWTKRFMKYFDIDKTTISLLQPYGTKAVFIPSDGDCLIIFRLGYGKLAEVLFAEVSTISIIDGMTSDLKIDKPVFDIKFKLLT